MMLACIDTKNVKYKKIRDKIRYYFKPDVNEENIKYKVNDILKIDAGLMQNNSYMTSKTIKKINELLKKYNCIQVIYSGDEEVKKKLCDLGVKFVDNKDTYLKLLPYAVINIVSKINNNELSCLIIDNKLKYARYYIYLLKNYFRNIKIISNKIKHLEELKDEAMRKTGIAVGISDEIETNANYDVVICIDDILEKICPKISSGILFTNGSEKILFSMITQFIVYDINYEMPDLGFDFSGRAIDVISAVDAIDANFDLSKVKIKGYIGRNGLYSSVEFKHRLMKKI